MKTFRFLFIVGFALQTATIVSGQPAPPTVPSKGPKIFSVKPAGAVTGIETRSFHFDGKEYRAVLPQRDILSGPDWNPASPLPTSLSEVNKQARSELDKLVTDSREWDLASVEISKFSKEAKVKWYYTFTFTPVLQIPSLSSDSIVILTTLNGKPGHSAIYQQKQ